MKRGCRCSIGMESTMQAHQSHAPLFPILLLVYRQFYVEHRPKERSIKTRFFFLSFRCFFFSFFFFLSFFFLSLLFIRSIYRVRGCFWFLFVLHLLGFFLPYVLVSRCFAFLHSLSELDKNLWRWMFFSLFTLLFKGMHIHVCLCVYSIFFIIGSEVLLFLLYY